MDTIKIADLPQTFWEVFIIYALTLLVSLALIWFSVQALPPVLVCLIGLAAFVPGAFLHEGLHWLGYIFGGAPAQAIRIRPQLARFCITANCEAPIPAGAYRFAVAWPAITLGLLPILMGGALQMPLCLFWGALQLAAAGTDLALLWAMRSVPGGQLIQN